MRRALWVPLIVALWIVVAGPEMSRAADRDPDAQLRARLKQWIDQGQTERRVVPTMLNYAKSGDLKRVRLILDLGVDLNASATTGWTALRIAVWNGRKDVAALLLDRGAKPDVLTAAGQGRTERVNQLLAGDPKLLVAPGPENSTLLHWAVLGGDARLVERLLAHGAKIGVRDRNGTTPLHRAVQGKREATVRALLELGADVNAASRDGAVPLNYAVRNRDPNFVKLLLDAGADPLVKDRRGRSPLDWSKSLRYDEITDLLSKTPRGR